METNIQSPSIESFSYSWIANLKPSSFVDDDDDDSLIAAVVDPSLSNDQDEASSFIEMDPRLPPSKRFIRVSSDHFGFDFPIVSESPLGLVHADELISNGFLVPLYMKMDVDGDDYYNYNMSSSTVSTSSSSAHQKTITVVSSSSGGRVRCASLRRCQRLSKRFFQKYLKFLLRPLFYRSWRSSRGNNNHHHQFESCSGGNNIMRMRKWDFSNATSPRTSVAYSSTDDNWRRSCDSESSIYEAVLHCKRTQGK